jgi:hypothetical protein
MRWFDRFSPCLVGTVLNGTANRFSDIEIEIVGHDAKLIEMFLFSERTPFKVRPKRMNYPQSCGARTNVLLYDISFWDSAVIVALYPNHAVRAATHHGASGKNASALLAEVEALLEKQPQASASNAAASNAK